MVLPLSGDGVYTVIGATTASLVEQGENMAVWTTLGREVAAGALPWTAGTRSATMTGPTVGEVVRRYRRLRRMTQQELGEAIGSDKSYIGKLETSDQEPSLELLRRLAKALDIPASVLTTPLGYIPLDEIDLADPRAEAKAAIAKSDLSEERKAAANTIIDDLFAASAPQKRSAR